MPLRTWDGICRHTALAALAQLRCAAIRNAVAGAIQPAPAAPRTPVSASDDHDGDFDDADLAIPLGDAPVPSEVASHARPASASSSCASPRLPG